MVRISRRIAIAIRNLHPKSYPKLVATISRLPMHCIVLKVDTHLRHNEIRDTFAKFMDVCHGVESEPLLQPLQGESFHNSTTREEACLHIKTNRLWGHRFTWCLFDLKYFNPLAKISNTLPDPYKYHENWNTSNVFWMSNRAASLH